MSTNRTSRRKKKNSPWPAVPLLEFAIGLSELMKRRGNISMAEFGRRAGRERSQISNYLAGNENLTMRTMADLASALDGEVHVAVIERGIPIRWVLDEIQKSELAPDVNEHVASRVLPRAGSFDAYRRSRTMGKSSTLNAEKVTDEPIFAESNRG